MIFVAIGGAEDKAGSMDIWRRLVAEAGGNHARIVILTTATAFPAETRRNYKAAMQRLGAENAVIHHVASRAQSASPELVADIAAADIVFFSGGDQSKITALMANTPAMDVIERRYASGQLIVSGTSAGAAAAASLMICGGDPAVAHQKDSLPMASGLGFIAGSVIDTHFTERGRLPRLFNAVSTAPAVLGIGLDEDTGVIWRNDMLEVIGKGTVTFMNGRSITSTNVADIKSGETISCKGMQTTVLSNGAFYDVKHRRVH